MEPGACQACPGSCPFRRELEAPAFSRLVRDVVPRRFDAHSPILFEGEPAHSTRCVRSGHVKEMRSGRRGEDVILRILGPGAALGLGEVLSGDLYATTVETLGPVEACTIPAQTVREAVEESPRFGLALLKMLAVELREAQDERLRRTEDSVWRRTARALLRLSSASSEVVLPIRRIELAQWIGTTPETLSRTLHAMEGKGWVDVDRVHIVVRDRSRLSRAAGERVA